MALDVLAGLNDEQRQAVAHINGPLLVVAGAGSGKTRVITHRIANLIVNQGVHPTKVLAITFTNKAAKEMQERVERLIHLKTPWITTFHSAGLRMLKMEAGRLGYANEFTILDPDDAPKLFKGFLQELKIDPKAVDPKKIAARVSEWKNQLADIPRLTPSDDTDTVAQRCYALYEDSMRKECKLDFDDLLVKPVRMLEEDAALKRKWQDRFPYILIDEYQDTNQAQYRLIQLLGEHRNICATGDPDQAIYGWRGADIKNILNFEQDFAKPGSPVTTVLLETNYRSTKTILRAAQGVIQNNTQRKEKTIRTPNPDGEPIGIVTVDDEQMEAYGIASKVKSLRAEGRPAREIAVFYRTNAQSRILEDYMRRAGIPYRIVGGQRFYDREEVKHLIAWLRLLVNPRDRGALSRVINIPVRGIGDKAQELLYQLADDEDCPPPQVLERPELLERIAVGRNAGPFSDLARLWRMLRALPQGDPEACVRGAFELTGLGAHYEKTEEPGKAVERIANMQEVISAAGQFREANPAGGLPAFLDVVALNTDAGARDDAAKDDTDRVTLMTLHASKGLEFPVVFITGLEDGIFPIKRGKDYGDLEEERRLMYVGITRAMTKLYLSRTLSRMLFGQTTRNPPSMFLDEIPADCFERKDSSGLKRLPPETKREPFVPRHLNEAQRAGFIRRGSELRNAEERQVAQALPDDPFAAGDRIHHQVLGAGTVIALRGPADNRTIAIDFQAAGRKELQLSLAAAKLRRAR